MMKLKFQDEEVQKANEGAGGALPFEGGSPVSGCLHAEYMAA